MRTALLLLLLSSPSFAQEEDVDGENLIKIAKYGPAHIWHVISAKYWLSNVSNMDPHMCHLCKIWIVIHICHTMPNIDRQLCQILLKMLLVRIWSMSASQDKHPCFIGLSSTAQWWFLRKSRLRGGLEVYWIPQDGRHQCCQHNFAGELEISQKLFSFFTFYFE